MTNTKPYRVVGPFPAYGVRVGDAVELDPDDPLVKLNEKAGLITPAAGNRKVAPQPVMTCPLCLERKAKTPAKFKSRGDAEAHYASDHAGFIVPNWMPDRPEEEE